MKKLISIAVVLIMVISLCAFAETDAVAQPETRTTVITLEGMEEEITETLYVSEDGYSIWYQSDMLNLDTNIGHAYFAPVNENTEDGAVDFTSDIYMVIVPIEIPYEDTDAFLLEATGGFDPSVAVIGEATAETLENGIEIKNVAVIENDIVYCYYLVTNAEMVLCITAAYPTEAAEGFGVRFHNTLRTIEF